MSVLHRALLVAAALQLGASGGALAQNYSGLYHGTVKITRWPELPINVTFKHSVGLISGHFRTPYQYGTCSGPISGSLAQLVCEITAGPCLGKYTGPWNFTGTGVTWHWYGNDCRGYREGIGEARRTAKRARRHAR